MGTTSRPNRTRAIPAGIASALMVCLFAAEPVRAQSDPQPKTTEARQRGLFRDLDDDFKGLVSTSSPTWLAAGLAATLAALPVDDYISEHFSNPPGTEKLFAAGKILGGVPVQAGGAALVYAVGKTLDRPRVAAVGADLVRAQVLTQAITQAIKFSVRRTRPDGTKRSFPSGHSSTTFATVTVLQRYYGRKAGVAGYALAAFVAASRIQSRKHYLSDVVLGATVGIIVGRAVTVGHGREALTPVAVITQGEVGSTFVQIPLDGYVMRLVNASRGLRF